MQRYAALCAESAAQRAGLRFVKHNVRNEFDDPSDVARMFGVRSTPCFVFLVGGAKVRAAEPNPDRNPHPTPCPCRAGDPRPSPPYCEYA